MPPSYAYVAIGLDIYDDLECVSDDHVCYLPLRIQAIILSVSISINERFHWNEF